MKFLAIETDNIREAVNDLTRINEMTMEYWKWKVASDYRLKSWEEET